LKKNKIYIKNTNALTLLRVYTKLLGIRNVNPFTKRGLRGSRSVFFKKTGKKSS